VLIVVPTICWAAFGTEERALNTEQCSSVNIENTYISIGGAPEEETLG
jgi:hypothetical protein